MPALLNVPVMKTWNVGDIASAALLNTNIRDALNFLLNVPLFLGTQNNAQALPGNIAVSTPIALDNNLIDTYSGHSTSVNNSRYVAQQTGIYLLTGSVSLASTSGVFVGAFFKNGNLIAGTQVTGNATAGITTSIAPAPAIVQLNAGDYVYMGANVSVAVNTQVSNLTGFNVIWLHA